MEDTTEFEEPQDQAKDSLIREEVVRIVKEMEGILETSGVDLDNPECQAVYKNKTDPTKWISIEVFQTPADNVFIPLPEGADLEYPIYCFRSHLHQGEHSFATNPYGIGDSLVIGADQKVYEFFNYYLFNERGESRKYEEVYCFTNGDDSPEETIKDMGVIDDISTVSVLDFSPKTTDSRLIRMNLQEIEFVGGNLQNIRAGNYVYSPDARV